MIVRKKVGDYMKYQTHVLTSITASVALTQYTPISASVSLFAGVLVGSLLPDIDEPQSYMGRRTHIDFEKRIKRSNKPKIIKWLMLKTLLVKRVGLSPIIKRMFGHRGMTHTLLATLVVFVPYLIMFYPQLVNLEKYESHFLYEQLQILLMGIGFGYLFHILGDMLSKTGVPLFYPFVKRKVKFPLYTTGKWTETLIFFVTSFLFVWLMYQILMLNK